ncbi:cation exporting V-type ATPase, subunit E [Alteracholeplasma palmae J233]|uniref:Cation exporting V-type ATPase, subunit E n=1 Tax=Alteracholeplasma palmae (strain ATCC 49389 / J233) TaxID=1318466 RepID=U4KKD6_ALTPJ|nr:hypothetical protein [Alteracholeplasma palmae]CCV64008.1 cation exporting V-type ATPase, subunit E [Alteracholeplasma palmae J233]
MDYSNQENLYKYFDQTIKNESSLIIQKLKKELKEMKNTALTTVKNELDESKKITIDAKAKLLTSKHQKSLSELKKKYHLELMSKREQLLEELVVSLKNKLSDYMKTEAYKNKVLETLKNIKEEINYIEISPKDPVKTILKDYEIRENSSITGGILVVLKTNNLEVNQTFDVKIKEAKEWFYQNSLLFVVEK